MSGQKRAGMLEKIASGIGKGNREWSEVINVSGHRSDAHIFHLYIAGGAPNSVRALANLYAICRTHFPESHRIEVVDVLEQPIRALADAILVTPTLVRISPAPELQIIGNLSDEEEVFRALGVPQKENGCPHEPTI
jgi:circadian clock protein KaiB